jgi:hypothetical protein
MLLQSFFSAFTASHPHLF